MTPEEPELDSDKTTIAVDHCMTAVISPFESADVLRMKAFKSFSSPEESWDDIFLQLDSAKQEGPRVKTPRRLKALFTEMGRPEHAKTARRRAFC